MDLVRSLGFLVVSNLALSCGGETGSSATRAGSGGSSGSTGGSGASGAAGVGGSNEYGGSSGSSGSGGSSGMNSGGGVGGSGNGGTGGQLDNWISQHIADACSALSATPCSVYACLTIWVSKQGEANLYGCDGQLQNFLDCTAEHPFQCNSSPEQDVFEPNPACADQYAALKSCSPDCSTIYLNSAGCMRSCQGNIPWSVECTPAEDHIHCICKEGPNAGAEADLMTTCENLSMGLLTRMMCVGA